MRHIAFIFVVSLFFWHITEPKVIDVSTDNRSVLESKQQVIIKFAASWCTTCQTIAEPFEAISNEPEFLSIIFVHVDIDVHKEIATQHAVVGVPTFAYLDSGSKKGQVTGGQEIGSFKDSLRESIRHHFNLPLKPVVVAALDDHEEDFLSGSGKRGDAVFAWIWDEIVHIIDGVASVIERVFA